MHNRKDGQKTSQNYTTEKGNDFAKPGEKHSGSCVLKETKEWN